jgi:UDP-N-acetylglucosamine 2-epimerase (non-hydrolysing)
MKKYKSGSICKAALFSNGGAGKAFNNAYIEEPPELFDKSSAAHFICVVGTRPEAIKMLPVILRLQASEHIKPVVVSTGQHAELVSEVFSLGGVIPDVTLDLERSGSLNTMFNSVMIKFEEFCRSRFSRPSGPVGASSLEDTEAGYPAGVLVHGDTSSAAAAALSAFHMRIPVGHVEAGLRTHSVLSPWPEELNRQIISRVAAFHLAPTNLNAENLAREGIPLEQVFVTGNTGIDTLIHAVQVRANFKDKRIALAVADDSHPLIVATAHRRENWGGGLARIGEGLRQLACEHPAVQILLITHPNPAARAEVAAPVEGLPQVIVSGPLSYVEFAQVLAAAKLVISDSGGIQEEAPALKTPVLVTRESTERSEGLLAGTLRLVGTEPDKIAAQASLLLSNPAEYALMVEAENPYGDGRAASRVVAALEHLAGHAPDPRRYGSGFSRNRVLHAAGYPGATPKHLVHYDRELNL